MRNIKLIISYLGTAYHGFQVQTNGITVCEVLQNAMEGVFGARHDVKGCSRTDAGVHAARYCLNFHTESALEPWQIRRALNARLPEDIAVLEAAEAPADFHARYDCRGKRYVYRLWTGTVRSPFWQGRAYHYFRPVEPEKLRQACAVFVGRHDFAAFCGKKNVQEDTRRTITSFTAEQNGNLVELAIEGDGFLYNMVRILVGAVLAVNEGRLALCDLPAILEAGQRSVECRTMPACGLYLDEVFYGEYK